MDKSIGSYTFDGIVLVSSISGAVSTDSFSVNIRQQYLSSTKKKDDEIFLDTE